MFPGCRLSLFSDMFGFFSSVIQSCRCCPVLLLLFKPHMLPCWCSEGNENWNDPHLNHPLLVVSFLRGPKPGLLPIFHSLLLCSAPIHGCCCETFFILAYCGLVGSPHLTAKTYINILIYIYIYTYIYIYLGSPSNVNQGSQAAAVPSVRHASAPWRRQAQRGSPATASAPKARASGLGRFAAPVEWRCWRVALPPTDMAPRGSLQKETDLPSALRLVPQLPLVRTCGVADVFWDCTHVGLGFKGKPEG